MGHDRDIGPSEAMVTTPSATSGAPGRYGRSGAAPPATARPGRGWPCAALVPVGVASGAAGFAFHRLFSDPQLPKPVCAAAAVPLLLAAAQGLSRKKIPLGGSLTLSASLWLVLGCTILFPAAHATPLNGTTMSALGNGVLSGWAQLLNITLPVPPQPELLAVPFTLTWLAASIGAELAMRTSGALSPALPALLAFTIAVALSVPATGSNRPEAGAFTASVAVLVALRNMQRTPARAGNPSAAPDERALGGYGLGSGPRESGGRRRSRAALTGIPILLAVTATGMTVGPLSLFHRSAVDPRHYWPVPLQPVSAVNPLDQVAGWLSRPKALLFEVRSSLGTDWQLAVLDQFDGSRWTSSGRFTPAGLGVPWPPQVGHGQVIRERFRITGLGGILVPAANRPASIRGSRISVNTDTGMLLSAQPLHRGTQYSVTSELFPGLRPSQIAGLAAQVMPAARPDLRVPAGAPAALYALVHQVMRTGTAASAFQKATLLERYLQDRFTNDPKAPVGYTYGDLGQFFRAGVGTSVQFAEVFTLATRILGIPSRLVVGFTVGSAGPAAGTYQVHAGDALVWSEADFAGAGWVPFFPAPRPSRHRTVLRGPAPGQTAAQAGAQSRVLRLKPRQFTPVISRRPNGVSQPNAAARHAPVGHTPVTWILGGAGAALLCYLITVVLAGPLRRHRRRTRGTPRDRITGAWSDLLEQLADMGIPPSPGASNSAIAAAGSRASGREFVPELSSLAVLVTRTLFAPAEATDRQALRAWRYRDVSRELLRRATPAQRRLRATLTVGRGSSQPASSSAVKQH